MSAGSLACVVHFSLFTVVTRWTWQLMALVCHQVGAHRAWWLAEMGPTNAGHAGKTRDAGLLE